MEKGEIKSIITEVDPEFFLSIPDETVDNIITRVLNSEPINFEKGGGLKSDYSLILSNIANVVTIVAFIYSMIERNKKDNITINIIIDKFPDTTKSKKTRKLIEKILQIINKRQ